MDTKVVQQSSELVALELTVREAGDTEQEFPNPLGTAAVFAQFEPPKGAPAAARKAYTASAWRVTEISDETITVARNEGVAYPQGPQVVLWLRRDAQPSAEPPARPSKKKTAGPAKSGRRAAVKNSAPHRQQGTE